MKDEGISPRPGEWNPVTHPYRATFVCADMTPGLYGWRSVHKMFSTEQGARDWLATHKPLQRVRQRTIEVVDGYAGKGSKWSWRKVQP